MERLPLLHNEQVYYKAIPNSTQIQMTLSVHAGFLLVKKIKTSI